MERLAHLVALLLATPAATRRALLATDLHYGFDAFNERFGTRAPTLFEHEGHFHRRLFEHESELPHDQLQSFLTTLHPSEKGVTDELRASLEKRAGLVLDAVVDGDLIMHGTREHADKLRELPEVRAVVPLLPELKVTPHFTKLLPSAEAARDITLIVRLVPLERHAHLRRPAAELAEVYTRSLAATCASDPEWASRRACASDDTARPLVSAEGERTLVVSRVAHADALAVSGALSELGESYWIEPKPMYLAMNADAAMLTQSGSTPVAGPGGTPVGTTPMWQMGLHGEGQIVGVGDSGLDVGHCFFENQPGQTAADYTPGTPTPQGRKVVNYRPYADGTATGTRDHGTHVVGSILGKSSTPAAAGSDQGGVAYEARVSFTDIGPADSPGLAVPNDLVTNFFNIDYDNGARIHSNSWGCAPRAVAHAMPTHALACTHHHLPLGAHARRMRTGKFTYSRASPAPHPPLCAARAVPTRPRTPSPPPMSTSSCIASMTCSSSLRQATRGRRGPTRLVHPPRARIASRSARRRIASRRSGRMATSPSSPPKARR